MTTDPKDYTAVVKNIASGAPRRAARIANAKNRSLTLKRHCENIVGALTYALDHEHSSFSEYMIFDPEDADTIHEVVDDVVRGNASLRQFLFMDIYRTRGISGKLLERVSLDGTTPLPTTTMRRKHREYRFACRYKVEIASSEETTEEPSPDEPAPMSAEMRAAAMALVE